MLLENACMFANLFSFFFNHKNAQPLFFLHLSTSGIVNNIKIICSIRFSLFITIDRFYKLFLAEYAFVNRRPEMILALFHTAFPIQPPPLRGTSFHRKEGVSTQAPSFGRGCRAQRGGVGFLLGRRSGALVNGVLETIFFALFHPARTLSGSLRSPPSPRGKALPGETVFSFLHPSHAKTTVSYERSFLCVLLVTC